MTGRGAGRNVALMGLLLATALVLSFFESSLAGLMALPPGIKPGLSNISVLLALLLLGRSPAVTLAVLKSVFVLLVRGTVAGILSLCGGLCSVGVMLLLAGSKRLTVSYRTLCIAGALTHNLAQLLAAAAMIHNRYLLYYAPVLLLSGAAAGWLTGTIYRAAEPYFKRSLGAFRGGFPEH